MSNVFVRNFPEVVCNLNRDSQNAGIGTWHDEDDRKINRDRRPETGIAAAARGRLGHGDTRDDARAHAPKSAGSTMLGMTHAPKSAGSTSASRGASSRAAVAVASLAFSAATRVTTTTEPARARRRR